WCHLVIFFARTRVPPSTFTEARVVQATKHHTALLGRTLCFGQPFMNSSLNWTLSRNSLKSEPARSTNSVCEYPRAIHGMKCFPRWNDSDEKALLVFYGRAHLTPLSRSHLVNLPRYIV